MAERNTLRLDTSGFEQMIKRLESVGGDVELAVSDALGGAAKKIAKDTEKAMSPQFLPAKGKYSTGATKKSILHQYEPTWEGSVASVPVGFDFSKPGAGGYLITGTPRMAPNKELKRMYKGQRYMRDVQVEMREVVLNHLVEKMTEG